MLKNLLKIATTVGLICFFIIGGGTWYYINNFSTSNAQRTTISISPGATVREVSTQVRDKHVIKLGNVLGLYLRASNCTPRPGKHVIPAHIPLLKLVEILTQNDETLYFLTIVEGSAPREAIDLINVNTRFTGDDISTHDPAPVLGNTHAYELGESRQKIHARLKSQLLTKARTLWENARTKDVIKSPEELIVLASIIEKETALANERGQIAGVFVNRLRKGMRLQADCTVVYGLCASDPSRTWNKGLTKKELKTPSPFNTYMNSGLPPTAIANPSLASLKAAAHPTETKDLYFVANGKGGHVFSQTRRQHARKHKNWRRIRSQRKVRSKTSRRTKAPRRKPSRNA